MPGDTLLAQCTYIPTDSVHGNPTQWTQFGLGTQDEMCYNFIVYYPAVPNISQCINIGNGTEVCGDTNGPYIDAAPVKNFTTRALPMCRNAFDVDFGSIIAPSAVVTMATVGTVATVGTKSGAVGLGLAAVAGVFPFVLM
ncbi:hypothetical protein HDU98_009313 [Podochytrium sp. JEL0797]|nr:hypothetical protein HDU98_009313 [Podochytrium sp. JEL0797]